MIIFYQNYLLDQLKGAGVKANFYKTEMELKTSRAVHLGAVLFEKDRFQKDGSKRIYMRDGIKIKRLKKYKRTTKFTVVIGDAKDEVVNEIFSKFLENIDFGIDDGNGNYVEIEVDEGDWVTDKDSILKSKLAVQIVIEFTGGIYKDVEFRQVSVDIEPEIPN